MHKLVEEHLTRAITDRFNEGLKEPEKCERACSEVVRVSLEEYRKNPGYGVSRETLAWALESIATELEKQTLLVQQLTGDLRAAQVEIAELKGKLENGTEKKQA